MIASAITLAVAGILLFAIVDDLRNYRVLNEVIIALIVLFIADAAAQGHYREAVVHALLAAVLFAVILVMYARGWMGGGDAKLLGAAFLWLETSEQSVFAVLFAALTLAYVAAAKFGLAPSRGKSKIAIPLAPCIAGAWLLTLALSNIGAVSGG